MNNSLSFQDIILRLLDYWKRQGCLVWQPYNMQVGAGTMNPATSLRVLGPEPWNVVYVEPSIRPDDGRFGENPNRMQQHYQLQVILQPDPGNPQELYLKSLEAIGINPRQHDIRFVEDNWESPALGAWGLGWEVWLDGQEITQFTYFQQAGGVNLDPVAVEITYGLDRICLALQGVNAVWQMDYGSGVKYGDALFQAEVEQCRYYFEVADVEALHQVYDIYEQEAKRCLAAGLVITAHDYNLKCSHLFNVLDTRGAIGVTERANYFKRMRQIARQVAELYVAQRQQAEYPFNDNQLWQDSGRDTPPATLEAISPDPATFILEIGSEELPVTDLQAAIAQLKANVPALLTNLRLSYDQIAVYGTPRRLSLLVQGLAGRQNELESVVKGPPAERAFDPAGRPTQAAIGFANGKGVAVESLQIVEENGKRYVAAVVRQTGRDTLTALSEALPNLIAGLKFEKSMRWNRTNVAYSRPLRWFVALFGPNVVPFQYAGVSSGRESRGLRPYNSPPITIDRAENYAQRMAANGIVLDPAKRQAIIAAKTQQLAAERGGHIPDNPELLDEVTNLVERPTSFVGTFEERYLNLPAAVLIAVMKKHQRYFPILDSIGNLLPYFIAVRNGDSEQLEMVIDGNEHVIRARFADAEFFYKNDRKRTLEQFLPDLSRLIFQTRLGSMLDKSRRLEQLVPIVGQMIGLSEPELATAGRAASLAKADLVSNMVVEMTALQGVMGGHYARLSGESAEVAAAIAEQYQAVSQTRPGLALALADRLDSLMALFAAGLAPKGSNDPFALRRAAIHTIENLIANQTPFDLRQGLMAAARLLPIASEPQIVAQLLEFITGRQEVLLREQGYPTTLVKAVLAEQAPNPYVASQTVATLSQAVLAEDWPRLLDGYARCVRITRNQPEQFELVPAGFSLPAEQQLAAAYQQAITAQDGTLATFILTLRQLEPAITNFFDQVLVMDNDPAVRQNRLALLQAIANLSKGLADLSQLEGF